MRKLVSIACAAIACLTAFASAASAYQSRPEQRVPIFTVLPARGVDQASLKAQAAANLTIPFFQNTVKSPLDHHTYTFQIVGTDPTTSLVSTTVNYVPIVLRVHFADGTVLDPTLPGCNDTVSVSDRFFNGPLFMPVKLKSNGIDVGTTQIIDGFQRAEFWKLVRQSNYHVLLAPAAAPLLVDVNAPSGSTTSSGACSGSGHRLGEININGWDNLLVQQINKHAKPNQLPILMAYNVVETAGGCCIIGYHNAYGRRNGTQTYSTAAYVDAGIFSPGLEDIHAWTILPVYLLSVAALCMTDAKRSLTRRMRNA